MFQIIDSSWKIAREDNKRKYLRHRVHFFEQNSCTYGVDTRADRASFGESAQIDQSRQQSIKQQNHHLIPFVCLSWDRCLPPWPLLSGGFVKWQKKYSINKEWVFML